MSVLPSGSVLVRTWFGDDGAWDSLLTEVQTPTAEGFLANVTPVDDPAFAGLDAEGLKKQEHQPSGASVSFLADKTTLTDPEHPILAVRVFPSLADHPPFRVVSAALYSVENNLNLSNMDWEDFTRATEDGVFRGF